MRQSLLLAILYFLFLIPCSAQEQEKFKLTPTPDLSSNYKVYVPTNLEDSFQELKKMLHPDFLKEIQQASEEEMTLYHMGLGLWMRNNWGLWGGSRLSKYFNEKGIFHPDDMSGIILDSFWRDLHSKPINLEEQIAYYKKFWQVNAEPKKKKCPLDKFLLEVNISFADSEGNQPKTIHIGRCKRGHYWAYEYDKGWYKPNAALLKRIKESQEEN